MGKLMLKAADLAKEKGVDEGGYRILVNTNPEGGQVVFHLHMHLMGGRQMGRMG
jgi:histidine triad (HIT) family protein